VGYWFLKKPTPLFMGIIHRYLGALAFAIFASARQRLDRKADKENVASQVLDSSQLWMYIIV